MTNTCEKCGKSDWYTDDYAYCNDCNTKENYHNAVERILDDIDSWASLYKIDKDELTRLVLKKLSKGKD